jgi:hypothetical protein
MGGVVSTLRRLAPLPPINMHHAPRLHADHHLAIDAALLRVLNDGRGPCQEFAFSVCQGHGMTPGSYHVNSTIMSRNASPLFVIRNP